jgi:hypothetical protein
MALANFDMSKIAKNNQISINNETDLHTQVVKWIRRYHQDHIMLAGLGEFQTTPTLRIEGYRKGYTKGTCDLMILNNHTRYKGMGIEFKTPKGGGKLSEPQAGFLSNLQLNGYYILVSNDYDEIIDELRKYLEGVRIICPHCKKKTMYYKSVAALDSHCVAFHGRDSTLGASDLKRMRTDQTNHHSLHAAHLHPRWRDATTYIIFNSSGCILATEVAGGSTTISNHQVMHPI